MGDGSVLNTKNPVHNYNASGVFSVSLVITDGHGCQDKIQLNKIIKVNPNPDENIYQVTVIVKIPILNTISEAMFLLDTKRQSFLFLPSAKNN